MSNHWLRLWHDMPTDPKWRTIARVSGQRIGDVIAIYNHLLISASQNLDDRGVTQCNAEDLASALDMETDDIEMVLKAMQGRVLDGNNLTGWERRQPKREDNSSSRVKEHRDREKVKRNVTQRNAPEEIKIREDKDKKERKESKQVAPAGYTPEFLDFWEKYPRRDGSKSEAFKNYQSAITKGFTHAGIISGLEKFRKHVDANKIGQKYIAHASTWLSQCRWESDYDTTKPYLDGKPGGSSTDAASNARDIGESIIAKRQAARLAGDASTAESPSPRRIDTLAIPDLRQPESLRGQSFDDGIPGRDVSGNFR